MPRILDFILAAVLAVVFFDSAIELHAQTAANPVRGVPISLFDGTTLNGWAKQTGDASNNWIVKDGAIFRESKGGDLYHKHWYRDFELSFEWKLNAKGNSGLKYRVQSYGKRFLGCEFQVMDDNQSEPNKHSTGSLYALYAPRKIAVVNPAGHWNNSKIVVCHNRVEHWLNGAKVVEATFGSADWHERISKSKFNQYDRFALNREGRIFLQDHGHPAWFRNIVVTPLDCDQTANPRIKF